MIKKDSFEGQRMIVLPEKIIKDFINSDIYHEVYVTDIGFFPHANNHFRKREKGSMQNILIYCTDGNGWISIDGRRYNVDAGQYCIIPARTPHTYAAGSKDPWTIYWIHFSGDRTKRFIYEQHRPVTLEHCSESTKKSRIRLFDEIYYNLSSDYTEKNLEYAGTVLLHFLSSFIFEQQFARSGNPLYDDVTSIAIHYMKNQLKRKVTLEEIAKHCEISVSHLCLVFKKNTSHAPIEYINNLKIQRACELLDLTNMKITEIAGELGFNDPFYFTRVFRKSMGQSPRDYRRNKSG